MFRRFAALVVRYIGMVLIKEPDFNSEIPCWAAGCIGVIEILRLRGAIRFAHRPTLLRMTDVGDRAGS